ncbi:MAG TPA: C-GCAxxG-C-C family protein [Anaerolineales bacterium]|nr:C-GCAxxG-C-C family protein [Anaerolineales bacterium]
MSAKTERAKRYHELGYGCAQAVLASFAEDYGLSEEAALRISTGFGSGMGRLCEVCGALTGAFMVIGLKHGKVVTDGNKYGSNTEMTYRLVADLAEKFRLRNGSIYCRELIGHDLSNSEERAKVVALGLFSTTCGKCIRDAVELLEEAL